MLKEQYYYFMPIIQLVVYRSQIEETISIVQTFSVGFIEKT